MHDSNLSKTYDLTYKISKYISRHNKQLSCKIHVLQFSFFYHFCDNEFTTISQMKQNMTHYDHNKTIVQIQSTIAHSVPIVNFQFQTCLFCCQLLDQ